jgi:hypothetical protein
MQNMILVDCVGLLVTYPRSLVLMSDGFHLSLVGHSVIGEAIAHAIIADIGNKI